MIDGFPQLSVMCPKKQPRLSHLIGQLINSIKGNPFFQKGQVFWDIAIFSGYIALHGPFIVRTKSLFPPSPIFFDEFRASLKNNLPPLESIFILYVDVVRTPPLIFSVHSGSFDEFYYY